MKRLITICLAVVLFGTGYARGGWVNVDPHVYYIKPNETITFSGYVNWEYPSYDEVYPDNYYWYVFGEDVGSGGSTSVPVEWVYSEPVSYDYLVNTLGKERGYYPNAVHLVATYTAYNYEPDGSWKVYSGSGDGYAQLSIFPEPATVCLLGLGGLVVRRRRRA